MKYRFLFYLVLIAISAIAQSSFTGTYKGLYNGELITLKLNQIAADKLQGMLRDASSNFNIEADITGNRFAGDAAHTSVGLKPIILGELKNDALSIQLVFDMAGTKSEINVELRKELDQNEKANTVTIVMQTPKNAGNDPKLVGRWVKEENYNSGSGDNFMGSTFSQNLTFFHDGSLADDGSSATISGSNFFGQSNANESNKTPGVIWYTRVNQLYLGVDHNGIQQEVHLGRFIIENGNMLITANNGTKMLLHKK